MKVLFATTNPAKVKAYVEELKKSGIEVITIKDLGIELKVDENGKDAIENAYIKAKTYYDETKMITIGMDNNLFFENIPEEKQPGVYVRRVNGKELTDEEMIKHYSKLAYDNGGKIVASWVYGMVIYNGKIKKSYTWKKSNFYLVDTPSNKRNPGYPLDSISILPDLNKYFVDLTKEEKDNNKNDKGKKQVIDFITNSIKEM
jgi:inosine/xanthosine triphosphate pyrophosphatase family protein